MNSTISMCTRFLSCFSGRCQQFAATCSFYKSILLSISIGLHHSKPFQKLRICSAVFQATANDSNAMDLLDDDVKRIILMFWSFALIYAFCENGEMVANDFIDFEKELGQCNWYLFTLRLQRIYIIVLMNAEQSTVVHGFGNIVCVRESMKRVSQKSQMIR